ncbi:transcriptional regulator of the polyamine metabolism genes [Escherichia coli]|uniref:Transcriptional regulator of the polyamine metabolism genes n=1 Tax=Escherichia coli TaxID=562 RepID=A0A376UAQ6_ECOLX|nr:transcriptional regulator of the polyamine metabolism genes [Escherichia coli]
MSDEGLAPGKRLSEIRQQQGFHTSCRRTLRLTHSAISTIEQDKVSPAISTLQKLLKVYGLSLSEFFPSRKNLMSRRSSLIRTT